MTPSIRCREPLSISRIRELGGKWRRKKYRKVYSTRRNLPNASVPLPPGRSTQDSHPRKIEAMERIRVRLALILLAMGVTLGGGTLGFVLIEHYSVFDAFYMTLTTVTTVGYGEIHPLSHAGRVFNTILILFGVIAVLLAVGAMTQTIVELELNQFFGKRRIK